MVVDEKTSKLWDQQDERIRASIKDLNTAKLSKHSEKRLKERAGLSRKSAQKNIENMLSEGIPRQQFKGSLRRYLDKLGHHENSKKGVRLLVYNYYVYVVDINTKTAITMWHLPAKYRRVYDAEKKKTTIHNTNDDLSRVQKP